MKNRETVVENTCARRKIPFWLVLLDNFPTIALIILGTLIINQISRIGAAVYLGYALFSIVWFWARICPYCHHFDTLACPCGYGAISARMFKRKNDKPFKKVFRRNISIQFPNWLVPPAIAIYLIITGYSKEILIMTIVFVILGFVVIPLVSKLAGCKNCEIKDECPWMESKNIKEN